MQIPNCFNSSTFRSMLARCAQLAVFVLSSLLAVLLRFDFATPREFWIQCGYAVPLWAVSKMVVFEFFGLGRGCWRFISVPEVCRISAATAVGSVISAAAIFTIGPPGFPRSLYLLDFLVCMLLTSGLRIGVRLALESKPRVRVTAPQRTFIYGAGEAGVLLTRECRANPSIGFTIAGFIDDDRSKAGTFIQGVRVLGTGAALPELAWRHRVTHVLIAIPSATGVQMTQILEHCQAAGLQFRTMPGLSDIIHGQALSKQIRDVAVEDLLGRTPVHLEEDQIRGKLRGHSVIVTGAAGSIGSELCRQIARFEPAEIIGYDISETGLFSLEAEMRDLFPAVRFHPEIGSIQNRQRITDVLRRYRPAVLYHAAAYKHVPLMEQHVFEAVENNVLGTYRVAHAAAACGVHDFVMISSDKAVHPTSIMGATKRIAELIINSFEEAGTTFVSVRFGNVLGSNGSVVPVFKKQIAAGGPVKVTHPEMRRYFMTIPEAAQLVLQASTMGKGGEVFVLDMGDPVRIVDLARRLIVLSGLRPGADIRIQYSGIRPGEKLYEELTTFDESVLPTAHHKIKVFAGNGIPSEGMAPHIETLRRLCANRDVQGLIFEIRTLVPDYNLSTSILRELVSPGMAGIPNPHPDNTMHAPTERKPGLLVMHAGAGD